jgi:hypothetical protein
VVVDLEHAVEHVRGVERASDGRVGVGAAREQAPHPSGQRVRQRRQLALGEPLQQGVERVSEQDLPGEPGVGQGRVVQVVGQPEEEHLARVGVEVVGEQRAVDGDGPAVLGVVLRRLDHDARHPRRRRPRPRLPRQRGDERRQRARRPGADERPVRAVPPSERAVRRAGDRRRERGVRPRDRRRVQPARDLVHGPAQHGADLVGRQSCIRQHLGVDPGEPGPGERGGALARGHVRRVGPADEVGPGPHERPLRHRPVGVGDPDPLEVADLPEHPGHGGEPPRDRGGEPCGRGRHTPSSQASSACSCRCRACSGTRPSDVIGALKK